MTDVHLHSVLHLQMHTDTMNQYFCLLALREPNVVVVVVVPNLQCFRV